MTFLGTFPTDERLVIFRHMLHGEWEISVKYRWRLPCRPGAFTGPLGTTGSWTGGREMAEHSWPPDCHGQRLRVIQEWACCAQEQGVDLWFLGQECGGAWGSLLKRSIETRRCKVCDISRDFVLELKCDWELLPAFLGSLTIVSPLRKMMGWTLNSWITLRRSCCFLCQQ